MLDTGKKWSIPTKSLGWRNLDHLKGNIRVQSGTQWRTTGTECHVLSLHTLSIKLVVSEIVSSLSAFNEAVDCLHLLSGIKNHSEPQIETVEGWLEGETSRAVTPYSVDLTLKERSTSSRKNMWYPSGMNRVLKAEGGHAGSNNKTFHRVLKRVHHCHYGEDPDDKGLKVWFPQLFSCKMAF